MNVFFVETVEDKEREREDDEDDDERRRPPSIVSAHMLVIHQNPHRVFKGEKTHTYSPTLPSVDCDAKPTKCGRMFEVI